MDLHTLIVEDYPPFIEVAKRAHAAQCADRAKKAYLPAHISSDRLDIASTYQEAVDLLAKNRYYNVVVDLFFPENSSQVRGERATALSKNLFAHVSRKYTFSEEYKLDGQGDSYDQGVRELLETLQDDTKLAPLGLELALELHQQKQSFCILSQGDRHRGMVGALRTTIEGIYFLMPNQGQNMDKSTEDT